MDISNLIEQFERRAEELEDDEAFYISGTVEDNIFLEMASALDFYSQHGRSTNPVARCLEDLESGTRCERMQKEWPVYCEEAKKMLQAGK